MKLKTGYYRLLHYNLDIQGLENGSHFLMKQTTGYYTGICTLKVRETDPLFNETYYRLLLVITL